MSISISKFVRLLKSGTGFECIVDGGDFQLGVYVKDVELCDLDENLLDIDERESQEQGSTFRLDLSKIKSVEQSSETDYVVHLDGADLLFRLTHV